MGLSGGGAGGVWCWWVCQAAVSFENCHSVLSPVGLVDADLVGFLSSLFWGARLRCRP